MHKHILFPALLACPLLAGCGSSSDQSYACDDTSSMEAFGGAMAAHLCAQYDAIPSDNISGLKTSCTTQMANNVASCPAANRLGTCTIVVGGFTQHLFYYSDVSNVTAAQAQMDCMKAQMGTWSGT
jgi:hypothetical protein